MGEIKSTIDLVMEKTEGLTLSEAEKKALEEEKESRASQIIGQRYLQGDVPLKDFIDEWERSTKLQQRAMLHCVVGGMQLGTEAFSRGLQALDYLKEAGSRAVLERFRNLSAKFGKLLQKRRRKIKSELWAEFAKRGIGGSAVEPNVEVSPQWHATIQSLQKEFAPRIDELKKAILP